MRTFTAVTPSEEAIDHLDTFLEPRRAAGDFRWTRPEHFHITLAFMPEADDHRVDAYVERLAEALDDLAPGELALAGSVIFPNVAEGRVLATGVDDPSGLLDRLAVRTRNAAVASGIEVDGQPFRPHLTVARTGGRKVEMTNWVRLLDDYAGPTWPLASVEVIASHLGEGPRRSPRYETVASIRL